MNAQRFIDKIQSQIIAGLIRALGVLPLFLNQLFGLLLGLLLFIFPNETKKTTRINLKHCYPEKSTQSLIFLLIQSLIHQAQMMTSFCYIWCQPHERIKKIIKEIEGEEALINALAQKSGVLLLLPHLGNWELVNHYLISKTEINALYRPAKIKAVDELIFKGRSLPSTHMFPTNLSGVRKLYQSLKQGKTAVILPDQQPESKGGQFVPFFGIPAYTAVLTAKIIQDTQPKCLAIFSIRLKYDQYKIILKEVDSNLYDADIAQSLTALNRTVEACIEYCPGQYLWGYKRFKKRPEENQDFYK